MGCSSDKRYENVYDITCFDNILFIRETVLYFLYLFFSKDPYDYFAHGKSCASPNQCIECTLGKCIQQAHDANADGFSYNEDGYCRLCQLEHFRALQSNPRWTVYMKTSKHNAYLTLIS